jgi:hypothetical protein
MYCPYGLSYLRLSYPEDAAILEARVVESERVLAELHRKPEAPAADLTP